MQGEGIQCDPFVIRPTLMDRNRVAVSTDQSAKRDAHRFPIYRGREVVSVGSNLHLPRPLLCVFPFMECSGNVRLSNAADLDLVLAVSFSDRRHGVLCGQYVDRAQRTLVKTKLRAGGAEGI